MGAGSTQGGGGGGIHLQGIYLTVAVNIGLVLAQVGLSLLLLYLVWKEGKEGKITNFIHNFLKK